MSSCSASLGPDSSIGAIDGYNQQVDEKYDDEYLDGNAEFLDGYGPGKLHPIHFGDTLDGSRYKIIRKLGAGAFSTVWLARDYKMKTYVAIKITTAKSSSIENESRILDFLSRENLQHPGKKHVMILLDSFEHHGPNGVHRCLVFNVMGPSTSTMFESLRSKSTVFPGKLEKCSEPAHVYSNVDGRGRFPLWMAKSIMGQILLGIDFLHQNGVAHGDLQPGNVLFSVKDLSSLHETQLAQMDQHGYHFVKTENPDGTVNFHRPNPHWVADHATFEGAQTPGGPMEPESTQNSDTLRERPAPRYIAMKQPIFDYVDVEAPLLMKVADLGGAFLAFQPPAKPVTPLGLRSPELILREPITLAQDIWSFGCLMLEYITGRMLFSVMPSLPGINEEIEHMLNGRDENSDEEIHTTITVEKAEEDIYGKAHTEDKEQCNRASQGEHPLRDPDTDDGNHDRGEGADNDTDDDHVLQLADVLGPLPFEFLSQYPRSSLYFNTNGDVTKHYIGELSGDQNSDDIETSPSLEAYLHREKGPDLGDDETSVVLSLLRAILQVCGRERPSASELLAHPWFAEPIISAS